MMLVQLYLLCFLFNIYLTEREIVELICFEPVYFLHFAVLWHKRAGDNYKSLNLFTGMEESNTALTKYDSPVPTTPSQDWQLH